jgi:hypothetical protein
MGKRRREQRLPKVDEADPGLDLVDDWDDDGGEPVRVRPQRPKDDVEARARRKDAVEPPYKRERRRRREVVDF